jgi:hypothetical protein
MPVLARYSGSSYNLFVFDEVLKTAEKLIEESHRLCKFSEKLKHETDKLVLASKRLSTVNPGHPGLSSRVDGTKLPAISNSK